MPFQPQAGMALIIGQVTYRVAPHPVEAQQPYGLEGSTASVYKIVAENGKECALKVFKPRYCVPALVELGNRLAAYADIPGLAVCSRSVLTPQRDSVTLRQQPALIYAEIMPWIPGPTWCEVLQQKGRVSLAQCRRLAESLLHTLAVMEKRSVAHCDLCSKNVIMRELWHAGTSGGLSGSMIEFVDVEQVYAPGLTQPDILTGECGGYIHRAATQAQSRWSAIADRFAGAVLTAELLGWCDEAVRGSCWGASFFDPAEVQTDSPRYRLLLEAVSRHGSAWMARLFEQAWHSATLSECPAFSEWLAAASDTRERGAERVESAPEPIVTAPDEAVRLAQFRQASLPPLPRQLDVTEDAPLTTWQARSGAESQASRILPILGIFGGIGVLLLVAIFAFGGNITSLAMALYAAGGFVWYSAVGAGIVAAIVGLVEVWVFRGKMKSGSRWFFTGATALGGLVGGALGALLLGPDANGEAGGLVIGGIAGFLGGLVQSRLLSSPGTEGKWIAWNTLSWAAIWFGGYLLDTMIEGVNGTAVTSAFIVIVTGIGLSWFLYRSPEIEF